MRVEEFNKFRLVGGTALSLQLGHRISVDIDLFTDENYRTIDFGKIAELLEKKYGKIHQNHLEIIGMGKSFSLKHDSKDALKVDVYYTDPFVFPMIETDGIRMASLEEISAMKLEILLNGGRKKDFWDLHELLERFTFKEMISFHSKRYYSDETYNHWKSCLHNFTKADLDADPECLRGKFWDLIKLDLLEI